MMRAYILFLSQTYLWQVYWEWERLVQIDRIDLRFHSYSFQSISCISKCCSSIHLGDWYHANATHRRINQDISDIISPRRIRGRDFAFTGSFQKNMEKLIEDLLNRSSKSDLQRFPSSPFIALEKNIPWNYIEKIIIEGKSEFSCACAFA